MTARPTTTDYIIDGQNVAQEITRDDQNTVIANATYCYGPRGAECKRDNLTQTERWYVLDGLGSVLAEVDEQGEVKANHRCDVWGSDRLLNPGDPKSKHAFVGNLGHTSGDTPGLIYMRARWYDPAVGRFISEDPAQDGVNWYAYCTNDPVGCVDVDGKLPHPAVAVASEILFYIGVAFTVAAITAAGRSWTKAGAAQAMNYANMAVAMFGLASVGIVNAQTVAYILAGTALVQAEIAFMVTANAAGQKTQAGAAIAAASAYQLFLTGALVSIGAEMAGQ